MALTSGSAARYLLPRWSGDDKRIAFADQTGRLYVIDVTGRKRLMVARDPVELAPDYRWSPDGQFLAYTLNEDNGYSSVYVWSVADASSHRVTAESFSSSSPAWAPNGELLYFLSAHEFQPLISTVEFDFATDRQIGIFAVALRPGVSNPYGVRDDEPVTTSKAPTRTRPRANR